jgi:biopolymer transport protein ExbD
MSELSAAQRGKIRRLSQPKELSPDEEGGELNIVPFLDIVVNILIFVLATVAVTFTATIETKPPSSGGTHSVVKSESLSLTVLIASDGFSMKTSGGSVATGCTGVGGGITVPKRGAKYDYKSLNECAARLKSSSAEFEKEDQFSVSANPDIDYQVVIQVIDALRTTPDGKGTLFSNVNFSVPQ